ncbi:hypothetical protein ACFYXF_33300 [Streptomyces sp. NPDC002680]|uniref:hypothetical protein n=1 Tax=Streptomyces sp. NPDC002680 TaxID=3364659 RepID=UPI00368E2FF1
MRKTIEVIDDFYRDPYAQREQALASDSTTPDGTPTHVLSNGKVMVPDAETRARISSLLGHVGESLPELTSRLAFVSAGEEGEGATPHTYNSQWAALVYLALPKGQFSGGVEFYRPAAASSTPSPNGSTARDENPHSEHWEETTYVPLTFNRMVLFQGAMAHRYTVRSVDRDSVEDHIAQLFLFDEPDGGR